MAFRKRLTPIQIPVDDLLFLTPAQSELLHKSCHRQPELERSTVSPLNLQEQEQEFDLQPEENEHYSEARQAFTTNTYPGAVGTCQHETTKEKEEEKSKKAEFNELNLKEDKDEESWLQRELQKREDWQRDLEMDDEYCPAHSALLSKMEKAIKRRELIIQAIIKLYGEKKSQFGQMKRKMKKVKNRMRSQKKAHHAFMQHVGEIGVKLNNDIEGLFSIVRDTENQLEEARTKNKKLRQQNKKIRQQLSSFAHAARSVTKLLKCSKE